jgi:hypothetical protein
MAIRYPTEADLARFTDDKAAFLDRLLGVIEHEIVPLTRAGVAQGNKVFGGAVLRKSDLSTVVAVTNRETANPLNHGEIATINAFYDIPASERPTAAETVFLSTHEPCPLCLGGPGAAGTTSSTSSATRTPPTPSPSRTTSGSTRRSGGWPTASTTTGTATGAPGTSASSWRPANPPFGPSWNAGWTTWPPPTMSSRRRTRRRRAKAPRSRCRSWSSSHQR